MREHQFIPYQTDTIDEREMKQRAEAFYQQMNTRRSVREFSTKLFDRSILDHIIMTAATAPSGAHKQPYTFCVLTNAELRKTLREKAEEEEKLSYECRMSDKWLNDLEPLGTNHIKPFIEEAPYVVVVFKRLYELDENGEKHPNYYVSESVGIAVGFFLAAVHNAGLVALTHTPSPMNFLAKALNRPENERAFVLIPVGFPAEDATVPHLKRKKLNELVAYYD